MMRYFHNSLVLAVGMAALVSSACDKKPPAKKPAGEKQIEQRSPEQRAQTKPAPAIAEQAKDDPATPSWLPLREEIPGWVRTSSVEGVQRDQWANLKDDKLRDCVGGYAIQTVLTFQYKSVLPPPGGTIAEVTLCEAETSDHAFGLTTCMMPAQPRDRLVGSMSCVERAGQSQIIHGWQGKYYIQVRTQLPIEPRPRVSIERLAGKLVRPIPTAEPPLMLSYFPPERRIAGRTWLVGNHLQTLPSDVQKQALRGSTRESTHALGLGPETGMAVAAYDPGEGEAPNYVWIVEYPTAKEASAALGRYKSILRTMKPAPLVLMDMPRGTDGKVSGRFLCGTWTADQESIMHVLPQIVDKLPNS